MIAVVQRVLNASVSVDSPPYNKSIEAGLCVFLGVEEGDDSSHATWMAKKLSNLRIFKDENEKMNCSLLDIKGELLLISQFTLVGDCSKGNRPSFIHAARPEIAEPLVQLVSEILQVEHHIAVKNGVFGAMMKIQITNDGPVTLIVQRD
jgi:D-tyrosyl-tRNA(Tyr) deacylase